MKKYIVLLGLFLVLVQAHAQELATKTKVSNKPTPKVSTKEKVLTTKETIVKLTENYLYDKGFKNQIWTRWHDGKLFLHIEADAVQKIPASKLDSYYTAALNQAKKIKEQILKAHADNVGDVTLWFASGGVYIGAEYPSGKRITERLHKD